MVEKDPLNKLRRNYLYEVMDAGEIRGASALYAFAKYLNREPLDTHKFPVYLNVLRTNNQYAIDALLEGYEPEHFLDMLVVPDHSGLKLIFEVLDRYPSNAFCETAVRVLCGFLQRVYDIPEEGCRLYQPTVGDINNLGKHLDESLDQDELRNRIILNLLTVLSDMDRDHQPDKLIKDAGRQANRVKAEFLDNQRTLIKAITEPILRKAETVDFGVKPEQVP